MRTSLVLSTLLHIVVLSAVLLNFHSSTPKELSPQPVTVELVSPSALTQVKAGKKDAPDQEAARAAPLSEKKPEPAPKAPEPKPAEKPAEKQAVAPPPPPKAAEPEPEKKVAAKPDEPKREEPKREEPKPEKPKPEKPAEAKPKKPEPKAEAKAEEKPEPKPEPKPEAKPSSFRDRVADVLKHPAEEPAKHQPPAPPAQTKRDFDADRIAALLNRDPKAAAQAAEEGEKEPWRRPSSLQDQAAGLTTPAAPVSQTRGVTSGQDARMSASEIDYFRSQISRCWTPPVGGLGGEDIVVKLRIELNRDGTLVKAPQLANSGSSAFFTAAADSAVRAVFQCQPYTMPPEKYSQWRDMLLNFDPRRMYGG